MAKTKQRKESEVKVLADNLAAAKGVVFINFSGLKVKDATAVRNTCRKEGIDYIVAKKTLLKRAMKDAGLESVDVSGLGGEIAVVTSATDEVAPAKMIAKFAKDFEVLKFVAGILDKKLIDDKATINLSQLPSKLELLAKLVGTLQAPVSGFVNVLQGNLRGLVYVLKAVGEKK